MTDSLLRCDCVHGLSIRKRFGQRTTGFAPPDCAVRFEWIKLAGPFGAIPPFAPFLIGGSPPFAPFLIGGSARLHRFSSVVSLRLHRFSSVGRDREQTTGSRDISWLGNLERRLPIPPSCKILVLSIKPETDENGASGEKTVATLER